jgi:hypothetical protein
MIYQKNPIEKSGNISHPLPPQKKKKKEKYRNVASRKKQK